MKQLFLFFVVLTTFACTKQEIDCDNYRSTCTYIRFKYSDCTPNGSELGWKFDVVTSDTSTVQIWGCPEKLNQDFQDQKNKVMNNPETPVNLVEFEKQFPSTCNCE